MHYTLRTSRLGILWGSISSYVKSRIQKQQTRHIGWCRLECKEAPPLLEWIGTESFQRQHTPKLKRNHLFFLIYQPRRCLWALLQNSCLLWYSQRCRYRHGDHWLRNWARRIKYLLWTTREVLRGARIVTALISQSTVHLYFLFSGQTQWRKLALSCFSLEIVL